MHESRDQAPGSFRLPPSHAREIPLITLPFSKRALLDAADEKQVHAEVVAALRGQGMAVDLSSTIGTDVERFAYADIFETQSPEGAALILKILGGKSRDLYSQGFDMSHMIEKDIAALCIADAHDLPCFPRLEALIVDVSKAKVGVLVEKVDFNFSLKSLLDKPVVTSKDEVLLREVITVLHEIEKNFALQCWDTNPEDVVFTSADEKRQVCFLDAGSFSVVEADSEQLKLGNIKKLIEARLSVA